MDGHLHQAHLDLMISSVLMVLFLPVSAVAATRQAHLARAGFVCPEKAWSEQAALQRLQVSNDGRRSGKTIARGRTFEPSEWPGL
jgi:hypothetical protein